MVPVTSVRMAYWKLILKCCKIVIGPDWCCQRGVKCHTCLRVCTKILCMSVMVKHYLLDKKHIFSILYYKDKAGDGYLIL